MLQLFEGPLAGVQFPDLDHGTLSAAADEVDRRQAELQRALEAVREAREALEASQLALRDQTRRGHAYATVFAENQPELAAALSEIKLGGRALAPKKRRGRPRKQTKANADAAPGAPSGKSQTSLSVAEDAA